VLSPKGLDKIQNTPRDRTLNRNGLTTGHGNRWTRGARHLPAFASPHCRLKAGGRRNRTWLNLSDAAKLFQVTPKTLRFAAEAGEIEAIHPLPEGPWIFTEAA
jgi:hypothetical protein